MNVIRRTGSTLLLGLLCTLWVVDAPAQTRVTDSTGNGWRVDEMRAAGYDLDEPSLIRALLQHQPRRDATEAGPALSAVYFLLRLPKSDRIVAALLTAANDPLDILAIVAMDALHTFGETQWHDLARARMSSVNPVDQLELAILLARAGQPDGWPVVARALRNPLMLRSRALRDLESFEGVVNFDGRPIDVLAELEALRTEVPEAAAQFTATIEWIHRRREYGRPLSPLRLVGPEGIQALEDAGYRIDEASSLTRALSDPDPPVRELAAKLLAGVPDDPAVVGALLATAQAGEDALALQAIRSLLAHGATGWEADAVARLATMKRGDGEISSTAARNRIALAGILAQAGRADGWPIITEALAGIGFPLLTAVREVPHFDGLIDPAGQVIDAAAVLRAQLRPDPEWGSFNGGVNSALHQVEARRSNRAR